MADQPRNDSFFGLVAPVDLGRPEAVAGDHPPLRLNAGDVLSDRFVVERLAGSGGMGTVYRALDRLSGAPVALKVMALSGEHEQRFAQEARVLAELNHPAIVRYVAHGETAQGLPYLAMEWLEGEDLAQRLARLRLTVGESLDVACRVAEGLAAAHGRGVVHRDVKPSNVLLVDDAPARAKPLDFGIVRMDLSGAAPTSPPMTRTGSVMGTVGYMSPEQAIGERSLDARTDVFALGCVLFECLTGEPVFSGGHVVAVLAKVLREDAPRVRALRPELPEALDDLVARMLSKDRNLRPEHGGAVLRELVALGSIAGGAPQALSRPAPGLSGGEQRITSVILAVVPEKPQGVSEVVRRHGGALAHLANGALLVTFGGRGAASEHVVIAGACALDLLDALPSARIALATGRALTTHGGLPGPVIDQAASLLAQSTAPGIQLDEVTAGLLGERYDVRQDRKNRTLMGKRGDDEASRTLLGKATPFVGRDKELALLDGTLRECIEESVARAVLVTGSAGQGKSRLRHEFVGLARARGDVRVLVARADPVGAGSAFVLVRQLVRQATGLREGDPVAEQYARLRSYVAAVCKGDDAGRIAEFLGELVGAPSTDRPSLQLRAARGEPPIMAEWLRRSFGEWLAAECDAQPVLLVLEDLHWGDFPSVTYLGEALGALAAKPLMLLALGRPEVHEAFPGLWSGSEKNELTLGRLAPRAAERLVRASLGEAFAADIVSRIVERADGNAFFLEELIRRVAEGEGEGMPDTVLALVQSRLERLDADARRVVRAASIFGEVFWRGGVAALLGGDAGDLDAWLQLLSEREVVSRVRGCRFPEEREYRFRHGLLRDASYAMLTDDDRTTGHRLAAEWLERVGEKDALTMADHFEQCGEPRRAAPWLARAAQAAYDGGNMDAAIALGHRGLACKPEVEDRDAMRGVVSGALAMRGDWRAAAEFMTESLQLFPVGSQNWFGTVAGLLTAGTFLGDLNITAPMIQAILGVSVDPEPSGAYGLSVNSVCTALWLMGQVAFAFAFLERAEALEKRASDPDPVFVVWLRVTRGYLDLFCLGQIGRALAHLSEARALAERIGYAIGRAPAIAFSVAGFAIAGHCARAEAAERELRAIGVARYSDWGAWYLGAAWAGTGRFSDAITQLRPLLNRCDPLLVLLARNIIAVALARAGDDDAAVLEARELVDVPSPVGNGADAGREALAIVALRRGRPAEAIAHADFGLDELSRGGGAVAVDFSPYRSLRAEGLHALGRTSEAHAAIREARESVLRNAAAIDDPELRESYLTNIIHVARTLELARVWLGEEADIAPSATPIDEGPSAD